MPFKTKRQKLQAVKRRVTISKQGLATYNFEDRKDSLSQNDKQQVTKISETLQADSTKNYSYISSELAKTLLFALIIIGLQLTIKFSHIAF